jgi:hypothetical protein
MKHTKFVLAAVLIGVLTAAVSAERSSVTPFRIEVELAGSEAKMRCKTGCTWTTTSYSCGAGNDCSFAVDGTGVEGIPSPTGR